MPISLILLPLRKLADFIGLGGGATLAGYLLRGFRTGLTQEDKNNILQLHSDSAILVEEIARLQKIRAAEEMDILGRIEQKLEQLPDKNKCEIFYKNIPSTTPSKGTYLSL